MKAVTAKVLNQWQQMTPVLRWGSCVILGIILLYPAVFIWDERQALQQSVAEQLAKIQKAQVSSPEEITQLQQQVQTQQQNLTKIRQRFWTGQEAGVVEVDIRAWLEKLLLSQNLNEVTQLRLETTGIKGTNTVASHWIIVASLTGQASAATMLPLIKAIETGEKFVDISQLVLTPTSFEITLYFTVLKDTP